MLHLSIDNEFWSFIITIYNLLVFLIDKNHVKLLNPLFSFNRTYYEKYSISDILENF